MRQQTLSSTSKHKYIHGGKKQVKNSTLILLYLRFLLTLGFLVTALVTPG